MKFLTKLFDLRGLKAWPLAIAMFVNSLLTAALFMGTAQWINRQGGATDGADVILMLGEFLVCGLVGFGIAYFVKDKRGLSYAVWGGLASFVLVIIMTYRSGILALLVALTGLLGAYNGGMMGARANIKRKS
jgi:hypothetical protein